MALSLHTTPLWLKMRNSGQTKPDDLLRHFQMLAPPVDIVRIVQGLGIGLHRAADRNWLGAVRTSDRVADIWYTGFEIGKRTRFTIAHELGHAMLHPLGEAFRDLTFYGSPLETQANKFAADLLMPMWMLEGPAKATGGNASQLADLFDVSLTAMEIRLRDLRW